MTKEQAIRIVLHAFDEGVFVRSTNDDHDPAWAIKLTPAIQALSVLHHSVGESSGEASALPQQQRIGRNLRNRVMAIRDEAEKQKNGQRSSVDLVWQLGRLVDDIETAFGVPESAQLSALLAEASAMSFSSGDNSAGGTTICPACVVSDPRIRLCDVHKGEASALPPQPPGQIDLGAAVVRYMAESMGMTEPLDDQEQNWICGHMQTFAAQLLGQPGGRDFQTRAVKTGGPAVQVGEASALPQQDDDRAADELTAARAHPHCPDCRRVLEDCDCQTASADRAPTLLDALRGMVGLIQLIQHDRPELQQNHRFLTAVEAIRLAEASARPPSQDVVWHAVYCEGRPYAAYPSRKQAEVYASGFSKPTVIQPVGESARPPQAPERLRAAFTAGFQWAINGTDKYGDYLGGPVEDGFDSWLTASAPPDASAPTRTDRSDG